jgi:hypothetical protein
VQDADVAMGKRRLIDETRQAVFTWLLSVLDGAGLIKGVRRSLTRPGASSCGFMRTVVRRAGRVLVR